LLGLTLYFGLLLFLYLYQGRILYQPDFPSRQIGSTPDLIGLDFEPVNLLTQDGVKLDGWFLPHGAPRATLLFFHGNAGNISHRLHSLELLHNLGLSVLIIDYRGYGRSEGRPSELGIYQDAEAAWRYLVEQRALAPNHILLFGRSFGGAVAAYLASRQTALGLVLDSTFTSAPEMAAELYPWLPARWLTRPSYDTLERLKRIRMPLMVIHSRQDDIIPFSQSQTLFDSAQHPKRFLELDGSHNYGMIANQSRYSRALDDFIDFCLAQKTYGSHSHSSPE
jgi:fermentation-respiration switch protein FrsA (DUF1100 family)